MPTRRSSSGLTTLTNTVLPHPFGPSMLLTFGCCPSHIQTSMQARRRFDNCRSYSAHASKISIKHQLNVTAGFLSPRPDPWIVASIRCGMRGVLGALGWSLNLLISTSLTLAVVTSLSTSPLRLWRATDRLSSPSALNAFHLLASSPLVIPRIWSIYHSTTVASSFLSLSRIRLVRRLTCILFFRKSIYDVLGLSYSLHASDHLPF